MFNLSIRDNVLYGKPNATEEEIVEALKSANAYDFIKEKMKENGLDTMVGSTGG